MLVTNITVYLCSFETMYLMYTHLWKPTTPVQGRVGIIGAIDLIWSWNSAPTMENLTSIYIIFLHSWLLHLKIEQLQTHAVCWFNTKTHNMIYSMYCVCVHHNCRYYTTDQIPNMVPGDRWDFSGNLIWKAAPEVGNLTEVQDQIPYYPDLSPYGGSGAYNW